MLQRDVKVHSACPTIASLCNKDVKVHRKGLGSGIGPSPIPSVLLVTAQRAGAAVSGLQLYVRCAGSCRARGGCRAPVSVSGAAVAQGAV